MEGSSDVCLQLDMNQMCAFSVTEKFWVPLKLVIHTFLYPYGLQR